MQWMNAFTLAVLLAPTTLLAEGEPKPAKLVSVSSEPRVLERTFYGQVAARQSVDLAFQVSGQIFDFPVLEGFVIPKDALIAKLDQEPFELRRDQAKLQKEQADRTVERFERLTGNTVSAVTIDDAETEAALAAIQLRDAEWALRNASLHAPFEGLISSRNTDLYSTVSAGAPVVRIHDMSELRIEVDVPEILFQRARNDDEIEIVAQFPAREGEYPLEILEFVAETSSVGQTFRMTFGMEAPTGGPQILPGSSVTVVARVRQPVLGIVVPPTALVIDDAGKIGVMQFTPAGADVGTVTWTPVVSEPEQSGLVLISDGLETGDEIVLTGGGSLQDGQDVRRFTGFAN